MWRAAALARRCRGQHAFVRVKERGNKPCYAHKTRETCWSNRCTMRSCRYVAILPGGSCRGQGIGRVDALIALRRTDCEASEVEIGVGCLTRHGSLDQSIEALEGRYRQGARTNPTSRLLVAIPASGR